jgi:hypothetical protein
MLVVLVTAVASIATSAPALASRSPSPIERGSITIAARHALKLSRARFQRDVSCGAPRIRVSTVNPAFAAFEFHPKHPATPNPRCPEAYANASVVLKREPRDRWKGEIIGSDATDICQAAQSIGISPAAFRDLFGFGPSGRWPC